MAAEIGPQQRGIIAHVGGAAGMRDGARSEHIGPIGDR